VQYRDVISMLVFICRDCTHLMTCNGSHSSQGNRQICYLVNLLLHAMRRKAACGDVVPVTANQKRNTI
jgi:hypothetical protein